MIIEWNGCSLVDATFEETQAIIERSGNVIQLLVQEESNIGRKGSKSILKMARSDLTRSDSAKMYPAIDPAFTTFIKKKCSTRFIKAVFI